MRIGNPIGSFLSNQSGSVAVAYGLAALPVMLAVGAGIDMVRYTNYVTALQGALDSAALSAAVTGGSDAKRIKAGEATLDAGLASTGLPAMGAAAAFKIDGNIVLATGKAQMPTAFMKLAGIKIMDVVATSEISAPETKKAEIALVLDYSGSMNDSIGGGAKYIGMRKAAIQLVNDLQAGAQDKVKIGLVPFSHHVYAALPEEFVLGQKGSGTWTGCTQDRQYPFNLGDATPNGSNASKWGQPQAPVHASSGCDGYVKNNLKVTPLTDDLGGIKTKLAAMTPYAWTHIALGVEFGMHVLSPNAPFSGGVSYSDKGTQKIMVVLTDGMQTEPAFGPSSRTVAQGEKNLEQLCTTAKANGIRMMTIAFDLDDTSTRSRLKDCASDPKKDFFVADDTAGVAAAFDEIRRVVTAQVFVSK